MGSQEVPEAISALRSRREDHLQLGKRIIEAYSRTLYVFDILAIASLNRSLSLLSGFCSLIEARNFVAAAPLIRLQLDNAMRLCASNIAPDPHEFSLQVMQGTRISRLKDREGHRLTDQHLLRQLAARHPWVTSVYSRTSGYVHLSDQHIFNAMSVSNTGEKRFEMKVSDRDEFVPNESVLEAIAGFAAATDIVFEYLEGWAFTKENPQQVADIFRRKPPGSQQDA